MRGVPVSVFPVGYAADAFLHASIHQIRSSHPRPHTNPDNPYYR